MHLTTRNVNTAFRELVSIFKNGGDDQHHESLTHIVRRSSRNGPVLMIDEPVTITYTHPKERVLFNQARDANPFFHLYESLWMLAGRYDVAPLAYYAANMVNYSDNGKTLNGAYGYRWRKGKYERDDHGMYDTGSSTDYVNQLDVIVAHLKSDPTSRRAVLQMWNVEDDLLKIGPTARHVGYVGGVPAHEALDPPSKDVCCNTAVYFSVRMPTPIEDCTINATPGGGHFFNSKYKGALEEMTPTCRCGAKILPPFLDMTVTNRSNDLIWGCLGEDYVTFSILQEYMAARIGVKVGRYNQFTNNLHVYESNWKPDEWLGAEKDSAFYTTTTPLKTVPLVKDPATFEQELPRIVDKRWDESPVDGEWKEPFFATVANPMFRAFYMHKCRDYESANHWCSQIKADDWRIAATNWITKRKEGHERRNKTTI